MMSNVFEKGITLLELTVVLLVLVALAGLTIPYVAGTGQMARCQATDATLQEIKRAIMGGPSGPGFYGDLLGYYPKKTKSTAADYNLHFLLSQPTDASWGSMNKYNRKTAVGWRGPYLQGGRTTGANAFNDVFNSTTNLTGKVHVDVSNSTQIMDTWDRPVILQVPYDTSVSNYNLKYARLVSAGPDGVIDTKIAYDGTGGALPDASDRNDDRVLYLKKPDPYPAGNTPCNQL